MPPCFLSRIAVVITILIKQIIIDIEQIQKSAAQKNRIRGIRPIW